MARNSKLIVFLSICGVFSLYFMVQSLCMPGHDLGQVLKETSGKIQSLKYRIDSLDRKNSRNVGYEMSQITLFLITPTYSRYTQQADLVRLSNTLKHVSNLHWILIEDSTTQTKIVSIVLNESGLKYTHLNVETRKDLVMGKNDPRWKKHRGVDQRNYGLSWIRKNIDVDRKGVVYFADDDNTYHVNLFKEMRSTKLASIWPVALVGGLRWEGPVCKNSKVLKFFTGWKPDRTFPVDMAAFAINLSLLFKFPSAYINPDSQRGYLETDFLEQLHLTVDSLEAKAADCTKILVWHTQTADPKMKQEVRLKKMGLGGSNPNMLI